jgi:hypothetical protein
MLHLNGHVLERPEFERAGVDQIASPGEAATSVGSEMMSGTAALAQRAVSVLTEAVTEKALNALEGRSRSTGNHWRFCDDGGDRLPRATVRRGRRMDGEIYRKAYASAKAVVRVSAPAAAQARPLIGDSPETQ